MFRRRPPTGRVLWQLGPRPVVPGRSKFGLLMIPTEIKRALDNGITQEEIIEISPTLAFFIGWKAASEAVQGIIQVFRDL